MGSTELAANLFRATQTEDKLRRERIYGREKANKVHHEVGAKVRQTIKELGGTMPENLPAGNGGPSAAGACGDTGRWRALDVGERIRVGSFLEQRTEG